MEPVASQKDGATQLACGVRGGVGRRRRNKEKAHMYALCHTKELCALAMSLKRVKRKVVFALFGALNASPLVAIARSNAVR